MAIKMVTVAIKITGTTTIKAIAYIGMSAWWGRKENTLTTD